MREAQSSRLLTPFAWANCLEIEANLSVRETVREILCDRKVVSTFLSKWMNEWIKQFVLIYDNSVWIMWIIWESTQTLENFKAMSNIVKWSILAFLNNKETVKKKILSDVNTIDLSPEAEFKIQKFALYNVDLNVFAIKILYSRWIMALQHDCHHCLRWLVR